MCNDFSLYIYIYIYKIKVGFKSRSCAKWLYQIAEIFLDFFILKYIYIYCFYSHKNKSLFVLINFNKIIKVF